MDFLSGSKSVQVCIVCLYLLEIPLTSFYNHATLGCLKTGPGFPTSYELVLFCVVTCNELLTITVYTLFVSINTKHYTITQRKKKYNNTNYDQQKENYTMMKRNLTNRQIMIHTERIHRKDLMVSPGDLKRYCRDQIS